jgi:hypothetical protein
MKAVMMALLILVGVVPSVRAQQSDAAVVARFRDRPAPAPQRSETACFNKPAFVVMNAGFGAISGWFVFMFGALGIMASDHGSVYRRARNRFMIGGALIGAGYGLYHAIADDCIVIRPRERQDADRSPLDGFGSEESVGW